MTDTCHACGRVAGPGELLLCSDARDGSEAFVLHRPSLSPGCFPAAGRVDQYTLAMFDPEAARAFDAAQPREHHAAFNTAERFVRWTGRATAREAALHREE